MRYVHVLMAVASEIWAMQPEKMVAIIDFLASQADGVKFTAEDIEAKIAPQTAKAIARREGNVAVIPLRGVISNRMNLMGNVSGGGGTSSEQFAQQLQQARDDDSIKAVVLDVDTPGGAVSGTDEAAEVVGSFKGIKPIIAQVNASAASAGYWMIAEADEIVVTPSGQVGSIGVYTVHDDISAALEKMGVRKTIIGAGPFKTETNPFAPLNDEARAYVQESVDSFYGMFVDRVAKGRGVASAAVRDGFGQGRMVGAAKAIELGMADRVSTMQDTLRRLGVGGKQENGKARAHERMKRAALL